jgi:hypothetical protein
MSALLANSSRRGSDPASQFVTVWGETPTRLASSRCEMCLCSSSNPSLMANFMLAIVPTVFAADTGVRSSGQEF